MAAAASNPVPMADMLGHMARQLSSLTLQQKLTKKQNAVLLASERKARVDECVTKLSNPMSVRAVKLNFWVLHLVEDILAVLKPERVVLVPTDLVTMGAMEVAQVVILEEVTRLLQRDSEVHQVAKDSHLGWNLLPFLDEEETAYEERDSTRLIKTKEVETDEKAYMAFHVDTAKTAFHRVGGGRCGVGLGAGRGGEKGKGKGKGRGRGKSNLNGVNAGGVGKSSKPRNGGCHRCGGPHFVRECTVAIQKPA